MPKAIVTVGLPFRNAGKYFRACIQSLLAQSFQDWTLIAIDDGSADSSLQTIRAVSDPRIQVISDGRALGLVNRLNQITALANTEYLARMDADDVMHPDRLATQVAFFEGHPDVSVAGSAAYVINGNTDVIGIRRQNHVDPRPVSVLRSGLFIHPSIMGRRKWFFRNPYQPEYIRAEDRELWCRTCKATRFGIIARPLLFYREVGGAAVKYCMSCRTDRKIIRKYGPEYIGMPGTASLVALSYAKEALYRIYSKAGLERRIIYARNTRLSDQDRQDAAEALALVAQTRLPGV